MFPNSEVLRIFHRNVTGYCLFPFHSDKQSISRLSKKLFPRRSAWFMEAYEHATNVTPNGYLYVDTSNTSHLKENFRIRNCVTPLFPQRDEKGSSDSDEESSDKIRAVAKKNNQFFYTNLNSESPTY